MTGRREGGWLGELTVWQGGGMEEGVGREGVHILRGFEHAGGRETDGKGRVGGGFRQRAGPLGVVVMVDGPLNADNFQMQVHLGSACDM